jgi:hypothetical protein
MPTLQDLKDDLKRHGYIANPKIHVSKMGMHEVGICFSVPPMSKHLWIDYYKNLVAGSDMKVYYDNLDEEVNIDL